VRHNGPHDGVLVEQIELERLDAQRTQALDASCRSVRADHLMTGFDQLGEEAAANGAARACN
jgi:hypothetical protein